MGLIYKLTNVKNEKAYIGLTTRDFETRMKEYLYYSKQESHLKKSAIYKAIAKYGWYSFRKEIIEDNIADSELDAKEIFYIDRFNSIVPNGYNILEGGRVKAIRKMGKANAKPVYKIDRESLEVIDYAASVSSMAQKVGTSPIRISDVCNRKSFTASGYIFRFVKDYDREEVLAHMSQKRITDAEPIVAFYVDQGSIVNGKGEVNLKASNVIDVFDSIYQASKITGLSSGSISDNCRGKRDMAGRIKGKRGRISFAYVSNPLKNLEAIERRRRRLSGSGFNEVLDSPSELFDMNSNKVIETFANYKDVKSKYSINQEKYKLCISIGSAWRYNKNHDGYISFRLTQK